MWFSKDVMSKIATVKYENDGGLEAELLGKGQLRGIDFCEKVFEQHPPQTDREQVPDS